MRPCCHTVRRVPQREDARKDCAGQEAADEFVAKMEGALDGADKNVGHK